jgi:hypothetical protein
VTHLKKISVHHFAQKPVTWAKFHQVLPFVQPFQQLCVEFEAVVCSGNHNWCFVTENLKFWQNLPYQDPCDKQLVHQVAL